MNNASYILCKRDGGKNCKNSQLLPNKSLTSLKTLVSKDSNCYVYMDSSKLYDYHDLKFDFSEQKLQLADKQYPLKKNLLFSN